MEMIRKAENRRAQHLQRPGGILPYPLMIARAVSAFAAFLSPNGYRSAGLYQSGHTAHPDGGNWSPLSTSFSGSWLSCCLARLY
jgi:hypothetical protein